jgi:hypothetical protein
LPSTKAAAVNNVTKSATTTTKQMPGLVPINKAKQIGSSIKSSMPSLVSVTYEDSDEGKKPVDEQKIDDSKATKTDDDDGPIRVDDEEPEINIVKSDSDVQMPDLAPLAPAVKTTTSSEEPSVPELAPLDSANDAPPPLKPLV